MSCDIREWRRLLAERLAEASDVHGKPDPPQLETILRAAPAEAVPVVRRLAELEAMGTLTAGETSELVRLRVELERWPEINGALAHAYLAAASHG